MPVMIRLLGKSEYGLYSLVSSVVSYLSLFSLGFTGAYLRFFSKSYSDRKELASLNGMFVSLFAVLSVMAFVCGMVMSCFPRQIFGSELSVIELEKATLMMRILVVSSAVSLMNGIFYAIVSAHEEFIFQRMMSLITTLMSPFVTLPLLIMGYGSVMLVVVSTLITVISFLINIWFCFTKLCIPIVFYDFQWSLLKEISVFSFFLLLNMVIDQINWNVDKLILGHTHGTEEIAVYGVASQFNSLFMTFSTTISSVFSPRVNHIASDHQSDYQKQYSILMVQVGRIQWFILGLVMSGFIIFGRYFIEEIYAGKGYVNAYITALFLTIPLIVPLIQNIGIEMQRALNKHKFRSIIYTIIAVCNVLISMPLAEKWGAIGASIGTAISLMIGNGLIINLFYHCYLKIDMVYFWKKILDTWKGFILPVFLAIWIMRKVAFRSLGQFLIWVFVYAIVYCVSIFQFSCNSQEKDLLRNLLKRV